MSYPWSLQELEEEEKRERKKKEEGLYELQEHNKGEYHIYSSSLVNIQTVIFVLDGQLLCNVTDSLTHSRIFFDHIPVVCGLIWTFFTIVPPRIWFKKVFSAGWRSEMNFKWFWQTIFVVLVLLEFVLSTVPIMPRIFPMRDKFIFLQEFF